MQFATRKKRETKWQVPHLPALAGRNHIVYVAMGYQHDDRRTDRVAANRPIHSKLAVTQAILRYPLARTCILGDTLARYLLEAP